MKRGPAMTENLFINPLETLNALIALFSTTSLSAPLTRRTTPRAPVSHSVVSSSDCAIKPNDAETIIDLTQKLEALQLETAETQPLNLDEMLLAILENASANTATLNSLRLVNRHWRDVIDNNIYLTLLNSKHIQADLQQSIQSGNDQADLYRHQQSEIVYFLDNAQKIQAIDASVEVASALARIKTLATNPKLNPFMLYQRHIALNCLNCLLLTKHLDFTKTALNAKNAFLTRLPSEWIMRSDLSSFFNTLKICNFSNNQIRLIPSVLFDCPALTSVNFSHNQVEKLPEHEPHSTLKILDLHSNQLRSVPENYFRAPQLTLGNFSHNLLTNIAEFALTDPKRLFNLGYNCLTTITANFLGKEALLSTQTPLKEALQSACTMPRRCTI